MLSRARDVLEPMFIESILPASGHGLLATQESWEELLDSMPNAAKDTVGARMKEKWPKSNTTPEEKWEELKKHLNIVFALKYLQFYHIHYLHMYIHDLLTHLHLLHHLVQ